jgi:type I restriction-modification system DNA methylase subunit
VVLGLISLKYVSDAFEKRQKGLREQFQNHDHDYYMAPEDYADDYDGHLAAELVVRDYYTEKNVFWVPLEARWQTLSDCAQGDAAKNLDYLEVVHVYLRRPNPCPESPAPDRARPD